MGKIIEELMKEDKLYKILNSGEYFGVYGFLCAGFRGELLVTRVIHPCISDRDMMIYKDLRQIWTDNADNIKIEIYHDIVSILKENDVSDIFIDIHIDEEHLFDEFLKCHTFHEFKYEDAINNIATKILNIYNVKYSPSIIDYLINNNKTVYYYNTERYYYLSLNHNGYFTKGTVSFKSTYCDDLLVNRITSMKFSELITNYSIFKENDGFVKFKNEIKGLIYKEIDSRFSSKDARLILYKKVNVDYFLLYDEDKYNVHYKEAIKRYVDKINSSRKRVAEVSKVKLVKTKKGYVPELYVEEVLSDRFGKLDFCPKLSDTIYSPHYSHEKNSPYYQVVFTYNTTQDMKELSKFIKNNLKTIYEWTMTIILYNHKKNKDVVNYIKPSQVAIKKSTHELVVQFELKATDILYNMSESNK